MVRTINTSLHQCTQHVSDNLLARNFTASKPNEKWTSDITYIKIERGFVYLAVVMDLFSRKIIGWSLDTTMTNQVIIDALIWPWPHERLSLV